MIKYRVTDVAKDLQIPNKAVIEAIEKYCGETKKAMTALNEQELDVVRRNKRKKHRRPPSRRVIPAATAARRRMQRPRAGRIQAPRAVTTAARRPAPSSRSRPQSPRIRPRAAFR